ncbi:OmpH family outer membrane protein [Paracoccus sp. MC1862]|uniref:OmpH family outer membrane protein n=1 Tax=Paracoccus sp. MC1862 TaxID=2760307 RepID=UPI0016005088|nr:OmpH family outer membrane protein [Paracoccus sp. MC1862]MBB1499521.1 OmpH family outer membrane protein [Paracoccus sp. MC1862]QQO46110.1 OmpH family outer membrane protein [Paracoccus sp. MC1862]
MRHGLGQAGLAAALLGALLAPAPVAGQEPPPARPSPFGSARPPQSPAPVPPNDAGDLAGPELSRPAAPGGPPPAGPGPESGAPLRVVPPTLPAGGAAAALGRAVLTVDQEAMYRQSRWGMRAQAELAAQSRQVAADNDRAFADLVADEDALTAARATLSPEEFRQRAARFDERVMAVRAEREAARNALAEMSDLDRALFAQAAAPVLGRLMTARGALVVLDQRTVLIADERIDVTAATIAALDAELGDGREIVAAALAQARAREEAAEEESAAPEPGDAPGGSAVAPAGTALDLPEGAPAAPQDPR